MKKVLVFIVAFLSISGSMYAAEFTEAQQKIYSEIVDGLSANPNLSVTVNDKGIIKIDADGITYRISITPDDDQPYVYLEFYISSHFDSQYYNSEIKDKYYKIAKQAIKYKTVKIDIVQDGYFIQSEMYIGTAESFLLTFDRYKAILHRVYTQALPDELGKIAYHFSKTQTRRNF